MDNPYQGQEPYETAWQQGHDYGAANPGDTSPSPPDFASWGYDEETTTYVAQVWTEGAQAGRDEAGSGDGGGGGSEEGHEIDWSEYPELVRAAQLGDNFDAYLADIGIDVSQLDDGDAVA